MTSLIAWIAVDQRAPSALYMASDSRISWGSERARWDAGRKLFNCRQYPEIFGYAGDVVFPSLVLGQITDIADAGLLYRSEDNADQRHQKFLTAVKASFDRRHNANISDFCILHGSREFSGSKSQFKLWNLSFSAAQRSWEDQTIIVPTNRSVLLTTIGTGSSSVKTHNLNWNASEQGGTSRAIFSAFCDSVRSHEDPMSGGVPQLVGMYHTRMPQVFGIVQSGRRYVHGFPVSSEVESDSIEWRDELFQRIDGRTLRVLAGAQRHARPRQK